MPARIPGDLILEAEGERLEQWLHGVGGADLVLALLEAREESKEKRLKTDLDSRQREQYPRAPAATGRTRGNFDKIS